MLDRHAKLATVPLNLDDANDSVLLKQVFDSITDQILGYKEPG